MLPEDGAIDRTFDYLVPPHLCAGLQVGTPVRVPLGPRRVRGWIVELPEVAPDGVALRNILGTRGTGPAPELLELAVWAADRWSGPVAGFLRTATPTKIVWPGAVARPPAPSKGIAGGPAKGIAGGPARREPFVACPGSGDPPEPEAPADAASRELDELAIGAWQRGGSVVRLPPGSDHARFVRVLARRAGLPERSLLVLSPTLEAATALTQRLRAAGLPVAQLPGDWEEASTGGRVVIGNRAGAWGPAPGLAACVVLDAHDDAYVETRAPTWDAAAVARERSRRAGVPWIATSPCPPLELGTGDRVLAPSRSLERAGWAPLEIVDRRADDPRAGLFARRVVDVARAAVPSAPVVCILNRTGRARLLACAACGELTRCERCGAAVRQAGPGSLQCPRCESARPMVCAACGSTRLSVLVAGVSRAREELEALVGRPVAEVTAAGGADAALSHGVVIGTEAALGTGRRAAVVVFLDFDQELAAPRYRAVEGSLVLLARASAMVGGRAGAGRVLVQTRQPRHEVLLAALHADPGRVIEAESARRRELRLPPYAALALVSGRTAATWLAAIADGRGPGRVEVAAVGDSRWLLRAGDSRALSDALRLAGRRPAGVRVEVDPRRV